ncbi:MAG: hypothetical protein U5M23_02980 [Marinagarivorans sp.]|nr:hypothetical protein [Marinagarivorans sp.]
MAVSQGVSARWIRRALQVLVGPQAKLGLGSATITRLMTVLHDEYTALEPPLTLQDKQYVPLGRLASLQHRLNEDRQCILVLMGATAGEEGTHRRGR